MVISAMGIAQSRITAQGQVSVPAGVRKALGVGPGCILEWEREGDKMVVRKVGKYTFEDVHRALFADKKVKRKSLRQLKEGIRAYIRQKHARD